MGEKVSRCPKETSDRRNFKYNYSWLNSHGKQDTDFTFSGHKEEDKWGDLQSPLRKIKRELYSQEHPIKANYLYAIGRLAQQMKQVAKMIR